MYSKLICKKCNEEYPYWHFEWKSTGGLNSRTCEKCRYHQNYVLRELKKQYKEPANGKCNCCGKIKEKLVLDHCHSKDTFRGWICKECNMAIGGLGDNIKGVWKAFLYLLKSETNLTKNKQVYNFHKLWQRYLKVNLKVVLW